MKVRSALKRRRRFQFCRRKRRQDFFAKLPRWDASPPKIKNEYFRLFVSRVSRADWCYYVVFARQESQRGDPNPRWIRDHSIRIKRNNLITTTYHFRIRAIGRRCSSYLTFFYNLYLLLKQNVKDQCKSQDEENEYHHHLDNGLDHFSIHWDISTKQSISSKEQHHVRIAHKNRHTPGNPRI